MHSAWVISSGTELTLGQTVDTNSAWLAARLAALGIRATRHVTVPDDATAIREAVLQAARACDVILLSGGLGPTDDDLTRQALADALGVPLELHPPSLEHLRAYFAARGRTLPEANKVQAYIPCGGRAIANTCGTAPGIRTEIGGVPCFAMPGVPHELEVMFARDVAPEIERLARGHVLVSRTLNTFGLGESDLGQRIADLMQRGRNPEVGTTANLGLIGIRINVEAPARSAALAMLDDSEAEIRQRLGDIVYGRDEDTLPGVIGNQLVSAGRTLATAESCTGGMVGSLITDVPGSSRYYLGGVVAYANAAKTALLGVPAREIEQRGAVSAEVAGAMAAGVARGLGADYGVAVTGVAGPTGGTAEKPVGLVFIGLAAPHTQVVREYRFGEDAPRFVVRMRAARMALNVLRLALLGRAP